VAGHAVKGRAQPWRKLVQRKLLAAIVSFTCLSCSSSTGPTASVIITEVSAFPDPALQTATTLHYGFTGEVPGRVGGSSTRVWDFGDGTTGTERGGEMTEGVGHVYNSPGVFTIRLTITTSEGGRASKEGTLTVKTLTGRWMLGQPVAASTISSNLAPRSLAFSAAAEH
jgi:hypothetical protein